MIGSEQLWSFTALLLARHNELLPYKWKPIVSARGTLGGAGHGSIYHLALKAGCDGNP